MRFLLEEVRHATRALLGQPAFTLHVVLTLALGIGATTAPNGTGATAPARPW